MASTPISSWHSRARSPPVLAGLDAAGHDLDQLSFAIGEMRRQAELADHHDLTALKIDRQHGDDLAGAHHLARLRRRPANVTRNR